MGSRPDPNTDITPPERCWSSRLDGYLQVARTSPGLAAEMRRKFPDAFD
jgi:hypothetical protein